MKILQIYKDFYPPVIGGIEKHINMLSKGLIENGCSVNVLVSNIKNKYEANIIDGIKTIKVPQIFRYASAPINLNLHSIINKLAIDADILHFHLPNPTAVLSYLMSRIEKPIVVTYHSDIIRQVKLYAFYKPFQNIFLKKVDQIIATSQNYINSSLILKKYSKKCCVIPLGIDNTKYETFDQATVDEIRKLYGNRIILFIGKFRYYKGLNILINAMPFVNGKLIIIGDGPLKKQFLKLIKTKDLGNKIEILGEVSDDNLKHFLHACDIFVLPSVLRSEAFGLVLAEAMACKKPVISTELNTGTSYINQHNKTGLVIPPNDISLLVEAINRLLDNPDICFQYGENGKKRIVGEFTNEKMVAKTIDVYKQILLKKNQNILNVNSIQLPLNNSEISNKLSTKKIKLVRIISRINIGGPSIHTKILSEGLNNNKYITKLIIGSISEYEADMKYILDLSKTEIYNVKKMQRDIAPIKDFLAFLNILKILNNENPDIIHTHMAKAGTLGRSAAVLCNLFLRKKIKIVHTFHGNIFYGYFGPKISRVFIAIERMMAKFTDAIIAISQTQKYELSEKYKIAKANKVHIINLGFDLSQFVHEKNKRNEFRKKIGINENCILIGIVGRLVPVKNHFLFLDAAQYFLMKNKDLSIKFIIVGDGELKKQLKLYAKKLNIEKHINFHGWEKEIFYIYSILDILVLTSLNEGTPVSIIEAMASSVPVVTTGVGGVKDLLGSIEVRNCQKGFSICERGILCDKSNSIAISNAIEYLLFNDNLKRNKRAKTFVLKNYSKDVLLKKVEDLYELLLKS